MSMVTSFLKHHHKNKHGVVSLRILDWLVTNYAKRHNVVYQLVRHGEFNSFNVFVEYKAMLKGYSKRFFDPFCRRSRVVFRGADGETLETTVGQLNFFRWAVEHDVVTYAIDHAADIENDMLHVEEKSCAVQGMTHTHVILKLKFS